MKRLLLVAGFLRLAWGVLGGRPGHASRTQAAAQAAAARDAQDGRAGRGRGAGRGVGRGARARKAVLAWADTRNGIAQHDSVSHALAVIERLGYESGLWDTYIRTDSNIVSYKPL